MEKEHTVISGLSPEPELCLTPIDTLRTTVQEMRASFAQGTMRDISFRKQQLKSLLTGLRANQRFLIDAISMDFGRPATESKLFEITPVEYEIGQFLRHMDKWAKPQTHPLGSEQTALLLCSMEVRKEPHGTVVIIGAWNYPVRLTLLPLIGALAAGNTVVLKPSEQAPYSAMAIEALISEYLDSSAVRVVQGGAAETMELLKHKFDHIFYTGNGKVGRIVAKAAAEHLTGVTLELGGKSPVIVHSDVSDLGAAATRIMWGKLANSGQTCVGVDYLLVHRSVKDKLLVLFQNYIINAYTKMPQKSPDYTRIVNSRHWQRIMALLHATEGEVINCTDDQADQADRYIPPTLVDGVRPDDSLMTDELFGPILPIITYDTLDEALNYISSHDQPLALYVFGSSTTAEYIFANTRSGAAVANDTMYHMAASNYPFGGTGPSGTGMYMGKYSFDTFSHHRSVMKNKLWFPPSRVDSIRAPPYSGSENAWKRGAKNLMYPRNYWLRLTFLGKLLTLFPLWRLLASTGVLLRGLIYGRSAIRPTK